MRMPQARFRDGARRRIRPCSFAKDLAGGDRPAGGVPRPVRATGREGPAVQKCSIYEDCQREADRFKWIESEKAGQDLGELAVRQWVKQHWCGYLRARWLEHLQ